MTKFLHFNLILPKKATLKQRKKYQSRTAAVASVDAQQIRSIADAFSNAKETAIISVSLDVGVTLCSLKDRYSKKDGRNNAVAKMSKVLLDVNEILINRTHIFLSLTPHKGVALTLRLNKTTGFATVVGTLSLED